MIWMARQLQRADVGRVSIRRDQKTAASAYVRFRSDDMRCVEYRPFSGCIVGGDKKSQRSRPTPMLSRTDKNTVSICAQGASSLLIAIPSQRYVKASDMAAADKDANTVPESAFGPVGSSKYFISIAS